MIVIISLCNSINIIKKTCKNCKVLYDVNTNNIASCKIHKGRFIGAEASKHAGTKSGEINKGLLVFWDCCDALEPAAIGCHSYFHVSYDDADDKDNYLMNNYKVLKAKDTM